MNPIVRTTIYEPDEDGTALALTWIIHADGSLELDDVVNLHRRPGAQRLEMSCTAEWLP